MNSSSASFCFQIRHLALPLFFMAGCAITTAPASAQGQFKHGVDLTPSGPRHASAPSGAHLTYYGGRIVAHPVYYNVLWASNTVDTFGTDIEAFLRDVATLEATLLREYSTAGLASPTSNQTIGIGTFGGTFTAAPASNATTVSDATIQTQLKTWIAAGTIPAPQHDPDGSNNTVYNIMFPHGTTITQGGTNSCQSGGFCAYHGTIANIPTYGEIYYVVMPDMQAGSGCDTGCGNASTTEANFTSVLSHEIAETITDAEVGLATTNAPPLAWYDNTNGEIGDICNAQQGTITGPSGRVWTMQTFFSNSQNNCVLSVPGTQTITFTAPANRALGSGSFTASATASSGLPVSFTGGTAGVCSVTSAGLVTLIGIGTCSLTANQSGGQSGAIKYPAAAAVTRTFSITAGGTTPQTITFGSITSKLVGTTFTVSASASSGLPVTFTGGVANVCSVTSAGLVTLLGVGTCSVTANQGGGLVGSTNYAAATPVTQTFSITTGTAAQTITFGAIPNQTLGAAPISVSATASSGLAVSFASLTTSICAVSGTTVTLLAAGQCSIQATQPGNGTYAAAPPVTQSFQITGTLSIINGGFETGTLSGWTPTGTEQAIAGGHTGAYSARNGSTVATNGDSTIVQTFTAPTGTNALTFWYKMTCPDTVTYDWATATLKDNTANTTATLLPKLCATNAWTQVTSAALVAGHSYTVTLVSHDDNYAGDPSYTLFDDVAIVASTPPPPPPTGGITNGGFETNSLTGWTPAGTTSVVAHPHSGSYAAQLGTTTATNGDSNIVQTFTAPTGVTQLSLYYSVHCPDTVTYDWAIVTLKDNTANTTVTVVPKTCSNTGAWVNATSAVVAGHSYTLTLTSHDDNYASDPTYLWYDDIILK